MVIAPLKCNEQFKRAEETEGDAVSKSNLER